MTTWFVINLSTGKLTKSSSTDNHNGRNTLEREQSYVCCQITWEKSEVFVQKITSFAPFLLPSKVNIYASVFISLRF